MCRAAPSSLSWGKEMFTVTGTHAASKPPRPRSATRRDGRSERITVLLAASGSRELTGQERQRHVPDVDFSHPWREDEKTLATAKPQVDPDVVAGGVHLR